MIVYRRDCIHQRYHIENKEDVLCKISTIRDRDEYSMVSWSYDEGKTYDAGKYKVN